MFWGDTHVHTSFSSGDANMVGTNDADPSIAYRFARGEVVEGRNGMPVRLRRPLDFLVIADHAENLGVSFSVQSGDPALLAEEIGRQLREAWLEVRGRLGSYDERRAFSSQVSATGRAMSAPYRRTVWQRVAALADQYNEPGRFTAFAGYEWTSIGSERQTFGNLHRVVVFRDDYSKTGTIVPFSAFDSRNPEDLFLARYEQTTGGQVLAIPHNGNVSNGEMFGLTNFEDEPLTAAYARTRQRWEPLYEVTQIKGDSETHPVLSPTDEFADFETWSSWAGQDHRARRPPLLPADVGAREHGHSQGGRVRALRPEARTQAPRRPGLNPFKFGLIGSTDSHTSLATADSDNFWGKYSSTFPSPTRMLEPMVGVWPSPMNWETSASGYAAVWAERNTREAIFAAMKRREVYATTGPADRRPFLRRLGLRGRRRRPLRRRVDRLLPRRADGRRSAAGAGRRSRSRVPGRRLEGPGWREPRPDPDRQGLDRRRRRTPRAGPRGRPLRRPRSRPGRQGAGRRFHRRRRQRVLGEHDRRRRAHRHLARSGLRLRRSGLLLRTRHRDPDTRAGPPTTRSTSA